LESQGVVRVQSGRGGGVVVAAPEASPVSRALELYLSARGVSGAHVLEAKREVELTCVRLATRRRTPDSVARLLRAVETECQTPAHRLREIGADNVHIVLAEMTGNPALHLFIESLTHLSAQYVDPADALSGARSTFAAHARIAAAVAQGDEDLAAREMAVHLDEVDRAIRG
jgi:DNA-binding FadR family transcriptional regulator